MASFFNSRASRGRVARALWWLVLLCLVFAIAPAHATIQLISDLTNFNVVNGELRAERVVTVLCPSSDWGSQHNQTLQLRSPRNTTDHVAFVCGSYNTNYQGFVAGYVPPRGKLYEQQVCSRNTNDPTNEELRQMRYNVFNFSRDDVDGANTLSVADHERVAQYRHMRLQRVQGPLRDKGARPGFRELFVTTPGSEYLPQFSTNGLSLREWKDFNKFGTKMHAVRTSALNIAGPAGAMANLVIDVFGIGSGGANDALRAAITQLHSRQDAVENAYGRLDARLDEYQAALTNVQQSLMTYVGATETLIMGVAAQANAAQQTAENVGDAVIALREEVAHTRDVQQRMINTLRRSTNILADQTEAMYGTIGRINDVVNDGFIEATEQFNRVYEVMSNVTRQSHAALTEVYGAINANALNTDEAIRRVVRSLGTTQSVLVDAIQDTSVMRALVSLVHSQFAVMLANETSFVPLLFDYGHPPDPYAMIPEDTSSPMMDVEILDVFLSPVAAPTMLRHDRFVFRCNVYFMMEFATQVSGWRDVLDTIGPSQCHNATTGAEQVRKCMCTVEVITTSCTRSSELKKNQFIESPAVAALDGSMCAGGVVPAPTSRILATVRDFTNAIAATCVLGSSHPRGTRVGSVLRKQTGFAAFVPSACSMDLGAIREATVSGVSLPFQMLQYLQYALQVSLVYADVYRPLVDGDMPNGLTYRSTPISRVDGRNARCTTAAYMAFDTTPERMIPVINYKATNAGARASVWVNGEEYSATTTTIASAGLGDAPSSFVSIGNPSSFFSVVDAPQHMLPLSMNPFARENTPLYAMFPTRNATAALWSRANGDVVFDAYSGSVDVSSLTRLVDSTSGRCVRNDIEQYGLSQAGSVCELREFGRFTPAPSTNAPHDVVYAPVGTSANAAYIATFRVPIGDLVGILFSACPVYSSAPVSPDVVRVTLANSGQQPITVDVSLSGRCELEQRVTIAAQGSFALDVRDCPNEAVEVHESWLHVRDLNGALCDGFPRNITVSRNEFVSSYGMMDATWVSKVEATVNNNLDLFVRQQQLQLAEVTFLLVSTIVDVSNLNGLVVPPHNFDAFADILNRTQTIASDIEESRKKFRDAITKNEAEYDAHLAELNARTAQFDSEWRLITKRYHDAVLAAEAARNQTDFNLISYKNASAALNASTLALLEAQAKLANATKAFARAQADFNKDVIGAFETFLTSEDGGWTLGLFIFISLLACCGGFVFVRMCWGDCCARRQTIDYNDLRGREVVMGGMDL